MWGCWTGYGSSANRERPKEVGDGELTRKLARLDRPEEEGEEKLARKLEMKRRLLSSPLDRIPKL